MPKNKSDREILIGDRQCDELLFKVPLVAKQELRPVLYTSILSLSPMEYALVDNTDIELHADV